MNTSARIAARTGLFALPVVAAALLPACSAGAADFAITAAGRPDVRLAIRNVPNNPNDPAGPFADFQVGGQGNPDNLYQFWWWYRVGDAARESAINGNNVDWTTGTNDTREAKTTFTLADKVTADMYFNIEASGDLAGVFNSSLVVTNKRDEAVTVNLFSYLDMDLAGTAAGDKADAGNPLNDMDIIDGDWKADYRPTPAGVRGAPEQPTRHQTATVFTIRDSLTDNAKTTLDNTGIPYGLSDFTTAYQWELTLAPGDSKSLGVQLSVFPAPVPEPSTAWLFIAGSVGLLMYRARRARQEKLKDSVGAAGVPYADFSNSLTALSLL